MHCVAYTGRAGESRVGVRRTISSGELVELAKTTRSRRQVPLSARAVDALDELPPRLDSQLVFPAARGGTLNLDNWRRRGGHPRSVDEGVAPTLVPGPTLCLCYGLGGLSGLLPPLQPPSSTVSPGLGTAALSPLLTKLNP
jgi:hypothetical protein